MKTCRDCNDELGASNWANSRQSKKDYLCTPCATKRQQLRKESDLEHADKMREYHKNYSSEYRKTEKRKNYEAAYRKANSAKRKVQMRKWRLMKVFGLSSEEFDVMLVNQCGVCAICKTSEPTGAGTWHIDHCHSTGKIRGLLCSKCNHVLGLVNDDPQILLSAINYLDISNENSTNQG